MTNQTGQTWDITGVQLESDTTPSQFLNTVHLVKNLEICQRYYQKSYDYDVTPGSGTETGAMDRYASAVSNQPTTCNMQ